MRLCPPPQRENQFFKSHKTCFWPENRVRTHWTGTGGPPYIQVGPPGSDFRGPGAQKREFKAQKPPKLIILGLLKFVKNSAIKPVLGNNNTSLHSPKGQSRRIFGEFQEAQDDQFWGFLVLQFLFLKVGTPKIGSGRSNLYIGRWSRGCLTPQIAGTRQ